jgi:CRISPR-associated protein Csh1
VLNTLLKIGEWQSEGKTEWDRFLDIPKVQHQDKKGNPIANYVLPIVFDLDKREVVIDKSNLSEFKENDVYNYLLFKTQRGNSKKIYSTVISDKLENLFNCFFGNKKGHLLESIIKDSPELLTEKLESILNEIFDLKGDFVKKATHEKKGLSFDRIHEDFNLSKSEQILFVYTKIKSCNHGYDLETPFNNIDDYLHFLKIKHFKKQEHSPSQSTKICYASGEATQNVVALDLPKSYSLNKMFVTETKNYASNFLKKNFLKNYQVSEINQEKLDYASNFILNTGGYKVRIANIDHVIVPQFMQNDDIDLGLALTDVKKKSDLLFTFEVMENFTKEIETETDNIFWINFIAYESDGNFFKSTELIKDVSTFHFQDVIKTFREIHWELRDSTFLNWNSIMSEYGKNPCFNLYTVYGLIPIRKDKEKKNKALGLFKTILENRKISTQKLYDYFSELILCHWYERYGSYTNIRKSSKDYFGVSVRESVFKYLAFIQVLKRLNLIKMEDSTPSTNSPESGLQYDEAIRSFFSKMGIQANEHKAMFYLGRMLNRVEWMQLQKRIKKTVIHLVNFNGLDRNGIERLYEELFNKARQHNGIGDIKFISSQFHSYFQRESWDLNPKEALFYLLSGYSFLVKKDEAEKQLAIESEQD